MIRDYKNEYDTIRRAAIDIVKTADDPENHILHLSFRSYGKSVFEKENKKLLEDAELDKELGVISETEYKQLKTVHDIIENSINAGSIY